MKVINCHPKSDKIKPSIYSHLNVQWTNKLVLTFLYFFLPRSWYHFCPTTGTMNNGPMLSLKMWQDMYTVWRVMCMWCLARQRGRHSSPSLWGRKKWSKWKRTSKLSTYQCWIYEKGIDISLRYMHLISVMCTIMLLSTRVWNKCNLKEVNYYHLMELHSKINQNFMNKSSRPSILYKFTFD
jgi:hypothetical protein